MYLSGIIKPLFKVHCVDETDSASDESGTVFTTGLLGPTRTSEEMVLFR